MTVTTTGHRRPDDLPWDDLAPGDYAWQPRHRPPCWVACGPEGDLLPLDVFTVIVEDNGTISVAEEIIFPGGWHGWLICGVWREVWP